MRTCKPRCCQVPTQSRNNIVTRRSIHEVQLPPTKKGTWNTIICNDDDNTTTMTIGALLVGLYNKLIEDHSFTLFITINDIALSCSLYFYSTCFSYFCTNLCSIALVIYIFQAEPLRSKENGHFQKWRIILFLD